MTQFSPERLTLWLTAILAVSIAYGTLTPVPQLTLPLSGVDKLHHFASFAALVLPAVIARPRHALWLAPLAIGYGGLIELIQPQVGREAEWGDVIANTLGVALGVILGTATHRLIPQRTGRRARD